MRDLLSWLASFALTQAIEVPILATWLRHRRHRWWLAFGASAITHPILWFAIRPLLAPVSPVAYVLAGESFAVIAEALYLRALGARDPLLASVVSNGASWLAGRALLAVLSA